jgi:ribose transport system permease protein
MPQATPAAPTANQPVARPQPPDPVRSARSIMITVLTRFPMVLALGVLLIVTTILYPGFWHLTNLQNLLSQNVGLMLCACGMTFVILAGGFDLSVGSVYAAGAMFYISFLGQLPAPIAVILAILLGMACGVINGVIINVLRVNPFVATLGTSSIFIGLITIYAGATATFATSPSYLYLGTTKVLGIPLSGAIGIIIMIISGLVLAKSTYGRSVYAVGGNKEAARLSGIRVGVISASTFTAIGAMAALGGVFTASQLGTATPNFVGNITLQSIAVVIVGGTALTGGEGAVWRTAVGLAIITVMVNLFTSLNFSPDLQTVFEGMIVIIAVAMDVWILHHQRTS